MVVDELLVAMCGVAGALKTPRHPILAVTIVIFTQGVLPVSQGEDLRNFPHASSKKRRNLTHVEYSHVVNVAA